MKSYDIIVTNSIHELSSEILENNYSILIKAPDDIAMIIEDIWRETIFFLLKNDCYYYSTYGVNSEKLHDLIDDLAFDVFPFIHNSDLTYENNLEEISNSWGLLGSKLITVWDSSKDAEGSDDFLFCLDFELNFYNLFHKNIIVLKNLTSSVLDEHFIKCYSSTLQELKSILLNSS